jgi:multiple sugar transport system permease protein
MSSNLALPLGQKHKTKNIFRINAEWLWGYTFIAPLVIGILIFSIGPILYSFFASFTKWDGMLPPQMIGIENYINLFKDKNTVGEIWHTLYYTAVTVPVTIILSILLANALNQKIAGKSFYRVIYFLPNVTMTVAIALIWRSMLNSRTGMVNEILGFLHLPQPAWMVDSKMVMISIMIISIWDNLGYRMVFLLAGLQSIPSVYYEAADIDGASKWKQFIKITLPLLSPTIFFVLVTATISALRVFDYIYMLSGSSAWDPRIEHTRTLVYGIFEKAFVSWDMGFASAEAVLLFFIVMVVTAIQFIYQKKWVHY